MCFCFDGESALVAYLPDGCRGLLPAASARAPDPIASRPKGRNGQASLEPDDAELSGLLAVVGKRRY